MLWNKFLPVILNLITASFCFSICLELLPIPAAAFSSTILLAQSLGFTATVVSGTQKAFIYPLFMAFIYFFLKQRFWLTLGAIALEGLFYPQILLITSVTLFIGLFTFKDGRVQFSRDREKRLLSLAGLGVTTLVLLPFVVNTNEFGPVITVEQAKQLPEFLPGGRSRFFYPDDPAKFWLKGRSGLRLASGLTPVTNVLGFLLPILMLFPRTFPLTQQVSRKIILFPQVLLASGIMFIAAHVLLFRLHLPSRYTGHSFRIIFSLTAGLVILILIDAVMQASQRHKSNLFFQSFLPLATVTLLGIPLLFYPLLLEGFPTTAYKQGDTPELYQFLQQQPTNSLVASLSTEANNIPSFAQRSIFVGAEYAIPYHWGYYQQFRQRTSDLITAQYSPDPEVVAEFTNSYNITFWLLDKAAFNADYLLKNGWLQPYQPATQNAQQQLEMGTIPVLANLIQDCRRFETNQLVLLSSACVVAEIEERAID